MSAERGNGDAHTARQNDPYDDLRQRVEWIHDRLDADTEDRKRLGQQMSQMRQELRRCGDLVGRLDAYLRERVHAIEGALDRLTIGTQGRPFAAIATDGKVER